MQNSPLIIEQIKQKIQQMEQDYHIRILYACESGSRGWEFASPDSDWDVRFIYAHPLDWYLRVNPERDVIELPINADLDISGWELRKSLQLLQKSNPALLEWLDSPIIYQQNVAVMAEYRALAQQLYKPKACIYHYHQMAKRNFSENLLKETVRYKKYFYVLRPVLACQWIEQGFGVVPMRFTDLLERLLPTGALRECIDALIVWKKSASEAATGAPIDLLTHYLKAELSRLDQVCNAMQVEPYPLEVYQACDHFLLHTLQVK